MLTELQAKHVTPFARDEAAKLLESNFLGVQVLGERIDVAKRHDGHHPFDWEGTFTRGNHCRRMTRLLGRRRLETRTAKDDTDTFMRGKRQRYTRKPRCGNPSQYVFNAARQIPVHALRTRAC